MHTNKEKEKGDGQIKTKMQQQGGKGDASAIRFHHSLIRSLLKRYKTKLLSSIKNKLMDIKRA